MEKHTLLSIALAIILALPLMAAPARIVMCSCGVRPVITSTETTTSYRTVSGCSQKSGPHTHEITTTYHRLKCPECSATTVSPTSSSERCLGYLG